jgi:hypothetical protein
MFLIISSIPKIPVSNPNSTIGDGTGSENILLQGKSHSDPLGIAVKWKYNASDRILFPPVVGEDGTIYIISKPFYTLHAINPDGTLKWKYDVEYKVHFAPVVSVDGTVYLCVEDPKGDNYLYAINNGIFKWKIKVEFEFENEISEGIAPGEIDSPPIMDEQGTIYFTATGKAALSPKAIFAINKDGTLRYKIANRKIERWGYEWKYGIDKFGDLIIAIPQDEIFAPRVLITARNGVAYITAVALKREYFYGAFVGTYRVIAAIDPGGKVKWVSELFGKQKDWCHIIEGKNALYLVIFNYTSPTSRASYDVYLQALDYDGKIRYKSRADEYWNEKFYSMYTRNHPAIDKDDTIYLLFSNPGYGDFSIIYAIKSNGSLKWKCKLPIGIWSANFFHCDRAGRLYLYYIGALSTRGLLYVINPNGEFWKYDHDVWYGIGYASLTSEDGTIYFFSKEAFGGYIHILSPEGKLIKRLSMPNLTGVDAPLENPILSPDGTILASLPFRGMLVAIGSPSMKKTMLTMNITPSKIVEKARVTITITGRLTNETGNGLSERAVKIYKDGNVIGSCVTDSNGYYSYEWKDVYLEKGTYEITVKFDGDSTYATSSESTTLTVTPSVLVLGFSEGWQNKELFAPFFIRSKEDPDKFVVGVFNRRDMWYLVKVYRRMPDKSWVEIFPWELPYLAPYSELTFVYPYELNEGDEIRIEVLNDPNDEALCSLIGLDFMMRGLLGKPLPRQFTKIADANGFKNKLISLYRDFLKPVVSDLRQGLWRKALAEVCKRLAEVRVHDLVGEILYSMMGERAVSIVGKLAEAAGAVAKGSVGFFVNWPQWYYLRKNMVMEPFSEDVVLTVRRIGEPEPAGLKITQSITIEQNKPYYSGETIRARFSIRNKGEAPVTIGILTIRASGPDGEDLAFTPKTNIRLNPGEVYNYRGELTVSKAGDYHFSVEYKTLDGRLVRDVPAEDGALNSLDIHVNPLPDDLIVAGLSSPGELRIYDSRGRVTGLVNGEERSEIPHSFCLENIVVILSPRDTYRLQVVGISMGTYNLTAVKILGNESTVFNAIAIPTTPRAVHQYTVDWDRLSKGERGVTVEVDSDGDGKFDWSFTGGKELVQRDFTPPLQVTLRTWIPFIGASIALILVLAAIILRAHRRKLPPPPPPESS